MNSVTVNLDNLSQSARAEVLRSIGATEAKGEARYAQILRELRTGTCVGGAECLRSKRKARTRP